MAPLVRSTRARAPLLQDRVRDGYPLALGGGGYDLTNVARARTAARAAMNGVEQPAALLHGLS